MTVILYIWSLEPFWFVFWSVFHPLTSESVEAI